MSVPRKFDHDEARRLHAEGAKIRHLADHYGVTWSAVYRAVNDDVRERDVARSALWQRSGQCPRCGAQTTRHHVGGDHLCRQCVAQEQATTVRDSELRCTTCGEWKPDEAFSYNVTLAGSLRRGRRRQCRTCGTIARQDYRERHREQQRAYDREYYKRQKQALKDGV